jgi:hypothetical protein
MKERSLFDPVARQSSGPVFFAIRMTPLQQGALRSAALAVQRPLPNERLSIVATGTPTDEGEGATFGIWTPSANG